MRFQIKFETKRQKVTICRIYRHNFPNVWRGDYSGELVLLAKSSASCAPADEFDEITGKRLALTRTLAKLSETEKKAFHQWLLKGKGL